MRISMGPADPIWDLGNFGRPHVAKGRASLAAIFDVEKYDKLSAEPQSLAEEGPHEKAVLSLAGLFGH